MGDRTAGRAGRVAPALHLALGLAALVIKPANGPEEMALTKRRGCVKTRCSDEQRVFLWL